jgi:Icc protein
MIIAQITDTHILPKGQSWLQIPRMNLSKRLNLVVEQLNKLCPRPDVLLLTGDTTDTGVKEAYQHLKEILKLLSMPVFIIPGNHDNREKMRNVFSEEKYMPKTGFIQYVIDDYPVRLIALDTHVPNEDYGLLCNERLKWLEGTLKENPSKPTLLFMHHFPMKVGQKCIDHMICRTGDNFEKLIQSSPHILGIVAGHYHKIAAGLFGGKICFVAPSVAPSHYFATDEDMHVTAIDLVSPSFSLHRWTGGFQMVSESLQVVKLENRLLFRNEEKKEFSAA